MRLNGVLLATSSVTIIRAPLAGISSINLRRDLRIAPLVW